MADAISIDYGTASSQPPLDAGVRMRLSAMMLLQFGIWGSWFTVWSIYLGGRPDQGGLGFTGTQVGSLYGTMALGAIVSMMVAGQLADRVMASEYLMAIFHLGGAVLLYAMAMIHNYNTLWWTALAYALLYNPTLAIANSISFANVPDATRDFPTLRVLGTIGYIVAGFSIDYLLPAHSSQTNRPLMLAAVLSAVLGVFSFALPHTPPSTKRGDAIPFIRALTLLRDPSFGIFFGISLIITIALAFYYNFAGKFLDSLGVAKPAALQTIGQMSEIFFMLMLPFALKRWGIKGVLAVGMAAWAARYGLFSLGHPFALIVVGIALHGVCFDFFLAAGFIHTENKAPAAIRASAQALFSFLTYGVGMWIGNEVGGRVVDHFTYGGVTQWSKVWAVPSVGALICLILFLLLWRDRPGKVEEAEPQVVPVSNIAAIEP